MNMPAVESTIHINLTTHDVFAFVSDYERDPRWRSEVVEMSYQSPGPTGIGRLALEKSKVFGRRLETLTEVTAYELDAKIVSRSISGPTPSSRIALSRPTERAHDLPIAWRWISPRRGSFESSAPS